MSEAKTNIVFFRPARMYGWPEPPVLEATITKDRGKGIVDLKYGQEPGSQITGTANAVPHVFTLSKFLREHVAVWWREGELMDGYKQ